MFFDIHTHILPFIDDGASSVKESVALLENLKEQGITDVILTPHFYPQIDNFEEFREDIKETYSELLKAYNEDLPNVYLGCELFYFSGMGNSELLGEFCLNNSALLLLELTDEVIDKKLFEDLGKIKENFGITPIIAHIERYHKAKNYKKLLKFVEENKLPIQINATSVLLPAFKRVIKKLLSVNTVCVIASDSHSVETRPPFIKKALLKLGEDYGENVVSRLRNNAEYLYKEIVLNGEENA
ncbi:MAG: hypothetical protein E7560_00460 [Ruminococcaceae bacterium]|nr:hypothetical protein [Oscillospiraceae bacterium]